jgi:hypothetical protein
MRSIRYFEKVVLVILSPLSSRRIKGGPDRRALSISPSFLKRRH